MSEHIGSEFDDFLREDGTQEEVTAAALKRVIAWQLAQAMKAKGISKTECGMVDALRISPLQISHRMGRGANQHRTYAASGFNFTPSLRSPP